MARFPDPQPRNEIADSKQTKIFSRPWLQWFQEITNKFNFLFSAPPVITGSRAGNPAVTDLLTQLASRGYIIDNTIP